ncbi:MAG: VOC family protein [Candidatus Moraniibacteriota bacterium]
MRIQELGHVVLFVSNLSVMADFYRDTLGFAEISRDAHMPKSAAMRTRRFFLPAALITNFS